MDLANNRLGLLTSEKLIAAKKLSDESIMAEFETALKKGNLIVNNRRVKSGAGK